MFITLPPFLGASSVELWFARIELAMSSPPALHLGHDLARSSCRYKQSPSSHNPTRLSAPDQKNGPKPATFFSPTNHALLFDSRFLQTTSPFRRGAEVLILLVGDFQSLIQTLAPLR